MAAVDVPLRLDTSLTSLTLDQLLFSIVHHRYWQHFPPAKSGISPSVWLAVCLSVSRPFQSYLGVPVYFPSTSSTFLYNWASPTAKKLLTRESTKVAAAKEKRDGKRRKGNKKTSSNIRHVKRGICSAVHSHHPNVLQSLQPLAHLCVNFTAAAAASVAVVSAAASATHRQLSLVYISLLHRDRQRQYPKSAELYLACSNKQTHVAYHHQITTNCSANTSKHVILFFVTLTITTSITLISSPISGLRMASPLLPGRPLRLPALGDPLPSAAAPPGHLGLPPLHHHSAVLARHEVPPGGAASEALQAGPPPRRQDCCCC